MILLDEMGGLYLVFIRLLFLFIYLFFLTFLVLIFACLFLFNRWWNILFKKVYYLELFLLHLNLCWPNAYFIQLVYRFFIVCAVDKALLIIISLSFLILLLLFLIMLIFICLTLYYLILLLFKFIFLICMLLLTIYVIKNLSKRLNWAK